MSGSNEHVADHTETERDVWVARQKDQTKSILNRLQGFERRLDRLERWVKIGAAFVIGYTAQDSSLIRELSGLIL